MQVVFEIPDSVAADLQNGGKKTLSRRALELLTLNSYKIGEITEFQIQQMLGFDSRFEVHAFLKANHVYSDYSIDDLDREVATLENLLKSNR
jgi:hypothetical protein